MGFHNSVELRFQMSWDERGVELSSLAQFGGHLLAMDDYTGVLFKVVDGERLAPWVILAGRDGVNVNFDRGGCGRFKFKEDY